MKEAELINANRAIYDALSGNAGRCSSCKWWERDADTTYLREVRGEFKFERRFEGDDPFRRNDHRPCVLTGYHDYAYEHPESKALSVDAEEYEAQLYTAPDFGCVQWQPRQEDPGKDS